MKNGVPGVSGYQGPAGGWGAVKAVSASVFSQKAVTRDIIAMFKEWGYCCCTSAGERLIPFETMDETTTETNFFFLHEEKHRALLVKYRV